jgi:inhibitor of cysteine peptidase
MELSYVEIPGWNQVLSFVEATAVVAACSMYPHSGVCDNNPENGTEPMLLITEKDNGQTVDTRLGETVRINLPENATTGYRWAIDHYDEKFIEVISTEPQYTSNAVGSGGEIAFIFRCKKVGTGEIVLKYWRHWEGTLSITSRFRLRLKVQP